jgi:hypothetical protein
MESDSYEMTATIIEYVFWAGTVVAFWLVYTAFMKVLRLVAMITEELKRYKPACNNDIADNESNVVIGTRMAESLNSIGHH